MTRRELLATQSTLAASAALPSLSSTTARAASLSGVAEAHPFSIEWLKAEARVWTKSTSWRPAVPCQTGSPIWSNRWAISARASTALRVSIIQE